MLPDRFIDLYRIERNTMTITSFMVVVAAVTGASMLASENLVNKWTGLLIFVAVAAYFRFAT